MEEKYLEKIANSLDAIAAALAVLTSKTVATEKYVIHNYYNSQDTELDDEEDGEIRYN